tara:strand:+ start:1262 stop:1432 length:171 start_codon:yes stop_codon:yes gene_type:complete
MSDHYEEQRKSVNDRLITEIEQRRADALKTIKSDSPEFYDDVKTMAKEIFKTGHTT